MRLYFLQLQARNAFVSEELSKYSCVCEGLACFLLFLSPDQTWELSSWISKVVSLVLDLYR